MATINPELFVGFDTIVYVTAAIIGFFISSRTSKLYAVTKNRTHKYLFYGFALLSISFMIMGLTSWYDHIFAPYKLFYIKTCVQTSETVCTISITDATFGIHDFGISISLVLSTIAYFLFVMMYFPKKIYFAAIVPFLLPFNSYFYIISLFLLSYVFFSSLFNFLHEKNRYRLLVLLGFTGLMLYQFLLVVPALALFLNIDAHIFLLLGSISFLAMVTLVQKK